MEKRNNWESEFVPFDLAFRLKKIGFDEVCFMYFKEDMDGSPVPFFFEDGRFPDIIGSSNSDNCKEILCTRPTFSQAFSWFIEEHNLIPEIYHTRNGHEKNGRLNENWKPDFLWRIIKPIGGTFSPKYVNNRCPIYSRLEAQEYCLGSAISIVEETLDTSLNPPLNIQAVRAFYELFKKNNGK
jgi:hypothetical protein